MNVSPQDAAAIGTYIDRVASSPIDRDYEAILRGMNAAADVLVEAADEPAVLEMLRADPVRGLHQLASVLRDARAPS